MKKALELIIALLAVAGTACAGSVPKFDIGKKPVITQQQTQQLIPTKMKSKDPADSNPLISNVFCADPTSIEYDGRLYIYGTCDQQQFDKKIELLRKKASDPDNVSFSIGVCYGDHGCDVRDAMGVADGKMYDDKQQFYVLHPERKHR